MQLLCRARMPPRGRGHGGADQRLRARLAESREALVATGGGERERSRSPLRRGGSAQRLAVARGDDFGNVVAPLEENEQTMRDSVGRMVMTNETSAISCRNLIAACQAAGCRGVEGIVKAGKRGQRRGNVHRDIMRERLKDVSMPEPYFAEVPY